MTKSRSTTSEGVLHAESPAHIPTAVLLRSARLNYESTFVAALRLSAGLQTRALRRQLEIVSSLRFRLQERARTRALRVERSGTSFSSMEGGTPAVSTAETLYTESVAQVLVQLDAFKSEIIQRIDDASHTLQEKLAAFATELTRSGRSSQSPSLSRR